MMIVAQNQTGKDDHLLVVAHVVSAARMDDKSCTVQTADGSTVAFAGPVESVVEILSDAERQALRDQFAGQALQGVIAYARAEFIEAGEAGDPDPWRDHFDNIADAAYGIADAMLAARKKGQQ